MAMKPIFGRKSGEPLEPEAKEKQPAGPERDPIDIGAVAQVFAIFGVLGFVMSVIFLMELDVVVDTSVRPTLAQPLEQAQSGEAKTQDPTAEQPEKPNPNDPDSKYPVQKFGLIGPLQINAHNVVLTVDLRSSLPLNTWSFIEAELLDAEEDYIFSFGDELWHEDGYDDGPWEEAYDSYGMKLTIPDPGAYYINIKAQGNVTPSQIAVRVSRRLGSSIPHFAFGMISLLIAFALNEYKNRTALRVIERITAR